MSHEVETMFSVKQVPWHGLGSILQQHPTSEEAIKAAGLDWTVEKRPLFWERIGGVIEKANRCGIVRVQEIPSEDPHIPPIVDESLLSVVSYDYQPVQNVEAFSMFDPLVKDGCLVYETAGSLFNGRKIWILARYVNANIKVLGNDAVRPYLLLLNGHDAETRVTVQPTPVRVVCNNTLMASLAHGQCISFKHHGDVKKETEDAISMVINMKGEFDIMAETWRVFTEKAIDQFDRSDLIFRTVYPHSEQPAEEDGTSDKPELSRRKQTNIDGAMRQIHWLLDHGQGANSQISCTVWGVYNALVEFAEYYLGIRARDKGNYQLLGEGAKFKLRALSECKKYCGIPDENSPELGS